MKKLTIYKSGLWIIFFFLCYSNLFAQLTYSKKDTILIKKYVEISETFDKYAISQCDSALYYLNKALAISRELNYDKYVIPIYKGYADCMITTGNYSNALNSYFKLREEIDIRIDKGENNAEIQKEYIELFILLGFVYYYMDDLEKSLYYFRQASEKVSVFSPSEDQQEDFVRERFQTIIYSNIGSVFIKKEDYVTARMNYEKALSYNEEIKNDSPDAQIHRGQIYNNLGIISRELQEYDRAFSYYDRAVELYNRTDKKAYLAQTYNNMANCYYDLEEFDKAIPLLEESLEISQKTFNVNSEKLAANILSNIYAARKDYKSAYMMMKKEALLNKSLLMQENIKQISQIENQYNQDKFMRQQREEQQLILNRKEKDVMLTVILAGILLFLSLILFFFYRNSRNKVKQQELLSRNLELEKQNLELEKYNLELKNTELGEDIESKKKELTTYVMYLTQKNNFMDNIIEEITKMIDSSEPVSKQKLGSMVREIKTNVDTTSWEEFEVRFQQVHQDFYSKLNELVPNLTLNEKRLCAFLRLNMTTKEISSLTFQSVKSIQVAKARLRKKMDWDKEENLISFLQKL